VAGAPPVRALANVAMTSTLMSFAIATSGVLVWRRRASPRRAARSTSSSPSRPAPTVAPALRETPAFVLEGVSWTSARRPPWWTFECRVHGSGTREPGQNTPALGILASMASGRLSPAARAFRAAHGVISVGFLGAIVYVWWCALTGRRDRWLHLAVVSLVTEGAFVTANHGDCPLGPLQDRLGDPVPLFELVLSPTTARRAVPTLGLIATAGLILLVRRGPRLTNPSVPTN
jgi:hypothetical protein